MIIAPSAICLALLLSSCSRTQNPVPQPLVLLPSESVFIPCERPTLQGTTWGGSQLHAGTSNRITNLRRASGNVERLACWIAKGINSMATLNVKNH
ncbi:TPA: Rz1-like lysis system protein LysC [Serratia fonticola]